MAKMVTTYKTFEAAKEAADSEHAQHGWYVAIVPIPSTGRFMLQANSSPSIIYSIGKEEE